MSSHQASKNAVVANECNLASSRRAAFGSGAANDCVHCCFKLAAYSGYVADHERHGSRRANDEKSMDSVAGIGGRVFYPLQYSISQTEIKRVRLAKALKRRR